MKLIMYGTNACPDCVHAEEVLKDKNISYIYLDWTDSTANLKRFLKLRDHEPLFDEVKKEGKIGIPCFQLEDGTLTLDLDLVLAKVQPMKKQRLREELLEKRKFLSGAYYQMADERICMLAAELPEFHQAEVVFCYVGMEGEINTRPLLEKALAEGKRLGVPRCEKKGVMQVYEIHSLQDLAPGTFGIFGTGAGSRTDPPGRDRPGVDPLSDL